MTTVPVDRIIDVVTRNYDEELEDVWKSRNFAAVHVRHIIWYLMRDLRDMSYPQIAKRFCRDAPYHHSSVLTGIRHVRRCMDRNPHLAAEIQGMKALIMAPYATEQAS